MYSARAQIVTGALRPFSSCDRIESGERSLLLTSLSSRTSQFYILCKSILYPILLKSDPVCSRFLTHYINGSMGDLILIRLHCTVISVKFNHDFQLDPNNWRHKEIPKNSVKNVNFHTILITFKQQVCMLNKHVFYPRQNLIKEKEHFHLI